MRRVSQRQQPDENAQVPQGDGRRPLSPPSLARSGERATVVPRGRLRLIPKAIVAFPPRSASRNEEMEERSRQRVRDQMAHMAFGAETRMRSSARGYP